MPKGVYLRTAEMKARMSAAKLGRPVPGHPHSVQAREKMRQAKLLNPVRYWLGKKRPSPSAETRAKVSTANKGRPKPEGFGNRIAARLRGIPRSVEVVLNMRAALATPEVRAKLRAGVFGKPQRHLKHPVFYLGIRMKSTYEVRVAAALDALNVRWEYEPTRFYFDTFTYTPDFYLPDDEAFWEVKGWYGPDSQRTVEAFRREHPEKRLVVYTRTCLEALEQAVFKAA